MNAGTWLALLFIQSRSSAQCNGATHSSRRFSLHLNLSGNVLLGRPRCLSSVLNPAMLTMKMKECMGLGWGKGETEEFWFCAGRVQSGVSPEESHHQEPKLPTLLAS